MLGLLYLVYFIGCTFSVLKDFYTGDITATTILGLMFLVPQYLYLIITTLLEALVANIGKNVQKSTTKGVVSGLGSIVRVIYTIITLPLGLGLFRFGRRK